MPRIKLQEQPAYEFQHSLTIRVTDLNYGAHLGNDSVVTLIHEARARLLHTLDCRELDLGDGQTGIIIGDLVVNFLQEGLIFDEVRIESHVGEISQRSFRIFHRLLKGDKPLALAETGIITFDYTERRAVPVPEEFLAALRAYQARSQAE